LRVIFALVLLVVILLGGCNNAAQNEINNIIATRSPSIGLLLPEDFVDGSSIREGLELGLVDAFTGQVNTVIATPDAYEVNLRELADKGNEQIWGIGAKMAIPLTKVAPLYIDRNFVLVNEIIEAPNVASLVFREEEGAYLAGTLAGAVSETGRIGAISIAADNNNKSKLRFAFAAGVYAARPESLIYDEYIHVDDENLTTTLNSMFQRKVDVIFALPGVDDAALTELLHAQGRKEILIFAFNTPGTKYTAEVLAYIKIDVVSVVETLAKELLTEFEPGIYSYGVAEDAITLEYNTADRISVEVERLVAANKAKIKAGLVKIPLTEEELDCIPRNN
jgi:basic membrane protein A